MVMKIIFKFRMDFRDFLDNFHSLDICNMPPESNVMASRQWTSKAYHSKWVKGLTAGGRPNAKGILFFMAFICQVRFILESRSDPTELQSNTTFSEGTDPSDIIFDLFSGHVMDRVGLHPSRDKMGKRFKNYGLFPLFCRILGYLSLSACIVLKTTA
jgi:hypothetical protein